MGPDNAKLYFDSKRKHCVHSCQCQNTMWFEALLLVSCILPKQQKIHKYHDTNGGLFINVFLYGGGGGKGTKRGRGKY